MFKVFCFFMYFKYKRKLGDGLFIESCKEIAQMYPNIKFETMIIDNCCMQVI